MSKMRSLLILAGLLLPILSAQASSEPIFLEKLDYNVADQASLQRGGDFFAKQCLVCHALKYARHDPLLQELGITYDKMPKEDQEWWFGTPPPDLSMIAREKTPDWLYTYLTSFYVDEGRPLGSNNLLVNNINMPNPFIGLQGEQKLVIDRETIAKNHGKPVRYFEALELVKQGSMTPDEFDQAMKDLVNFLVYVGDPAAAAREKIGYWVLAFLILFLFLLAIPLKKIFWKDIK